MPADVEQKALVCDGPRDAADILRVGLDHCNRNPLLRQQVGCRQSRRACAYHNGMILVVTLCFQVKPNPSV